MPRIKSENETYQPLLIPELKSMKQVFRDIRNYLAGQFVGATRDEALLDELLKCLFYKLYVETLNFESKSVNSNIDQQAKHVRDTFKKIKMDFPDIYDNKSEILLDPPSINFVLHECSFSLLNSKDDPIGDAFEVFIGSESRGRNGQFFTPRSAVDFLVNAIAPKPEETIIDPACGAGGFLNAVARYYLSINIDPKTLASLVSDTFFGIDKDEYLVKLAKLHVSLVSRGHPNISYGDSISLANGDNDLNWKMLENGFDIVLTNPPFGSKIVAASQAVLKKFELGHKWKYNNNQNQWYQTGELQSRVPPQILFIERCLWLLKEGGRLGIVVPESVLSNKSYRYVLEYLRRESEILAVVGMPESLFKTSGKGGTHTKTCLMVARKCQSKVRKGKIFMAEAKWCGHDSRAREIPNNDIPKIYSNYKDFVEEKKFNQSSLGFVIKRDNILNNILCPRYYDPKVKKELSKLNKTHIFLLFGDLVRDGILSVTTGDELGKLAYGGVVPVVWTVFPLS